MRSTWRIVVLATVAVLLLAAWSQAADAPAAKPAAKKADQPKGDKPIAEDTLKKVEAALPTAAVVKPAQPRKMLILTLTGLRGFRHGSIPLAAKTLELMGQKTGAWEATTTDDINACKAENLAKFDAFCSDQCTGNLTDDEAIKTALVDFVKNGKGWVGIHAATDSAGWNAPEYHEMIGGLFAGHPFSKISVKLDDPASPINAAFDGKGFEITDEIYTFKDPYSREKLHILLSIDWENAHITKQGTRQDNDYALSWIREFGKGRVFYCAFGHQDPIWYNPAILKHYLAGIQYAMGDLKADATPTAKLNPAPAPARGPTLAPAPEKPKAAPKPAEKKADAARVLTIYAAPAARAASQPATQPAGEVARLMGTVVKVDGNNLIVNAMQRGGETKEVTVATDDTTGFNVDCEPGKLTDLKPDMSVTITPGPATAAKPARLLVVANSRGLMGTVVKVDGKNVVLRVRQPGSDPKEVTVSTDEKTKVFFLGVERIPGRVGNLEDLKADMRVSVLPETGTAAKIIVIHAAPVAEKAGEKTEKKAAEKPAAAPAAPVEPSGLKPNAEGWITLFDGKDLGAFQKPAADKWKVVDGVLTWEKGCGNLWTKDKFGDFIFDLEVKCDKGTNSGLFLRSAEGERNWLNGSFEIQVAGTGGDRKPGKHDLGALYDCYAPTVAAEKPVGEWNHFTLTFKGNSLKIVLNDKTIIDINLDDWKEAGLNPDGSKNKFKTAYKDMAKVGCLGLQDHGSPVWYRNVKVKPLDAK